MANSPRNPNSPRPSKDDLSPAEDAIETGTSSPAAGSTAPSPPAAPNPAASAGDEDDWQLEEPAEKPAASPAKPRGTSLPAQPIPPPASASFESNVNIPAAVPLGIPRHAAPAPESGPAPFVPSSSPTAGSPSKKSPADSAADADPFDIDEELTLESRPKAPATPPTSPADSEQPRYDLGKITSTKSAGPSKNKSKADPDQTPGRSASAPAGTSATDPDAASDSAPDSESDPDSEFKIRARSAAETDPASGESPAPGTFGSKPGLIAAAVILLALVAVFASVLYTNRPSAPPGTAKSAPSLPITGKLVTLTEVNSGWRARQPGDLVSPVDVVLPTATRLQSEYLPQVQFSFDPATAKPGFLRFIFLDPDRKISGDVRVMKLANGTIEPLSSGALVNGAGATVYGSLGFLDRPAFVSYASNSDQRWSVEISESSDYNAKEKDWTLLETFDIRNTTLP